MGPSPPWGQPLAVLLGQHLRNTFIPKNNRVPVLGLRKEAENPKRAGRLRFLRDGQVPPSSTQALNAHTLFPGRHQPDSSQLGLDKTKRQ